MEKYVLDNVQTVKSPGASVKQRLLKPVILLMSGMLVYGCGRNIHDLQQYVDEVKSRKVYNIDPPPEVKPYKNFEYVADNERDPFDPGELAAKVAKQTQPSNPQLSPDPNRTPEFLESFPLDTLRMVGTLSQGEYLWALIRTPDSTIQRVSEGNYMGQNYGKVVQVSDGDIKLTEIVPDGYGGWRERASSVALSE